MIRSSTIDVVSLVVVSLPTARVLKQVLRQSKIMTDSTISLSRHRPQRPKSVWNLSIYFISTVLLFSVASLWISMQRPTSSYDGMMTSLEAGLLEFEGGGTKGNTGADKSKAKSAKLEGLSCQAYGGPADELAKEMVYWEHIPSDSEYVSPMKKKGVVQYLTFEPDDGGWNNIRMAMETVLAMAAAMGRTIVLPPEKEMYLLKKSSGKHGAQRDTFSFNHFFPMDAIRDEHVGLDIITMETYLRTEAMTGRMMDTTTKKVSFPPGNVTEWDGRDNIQELFHWLRSVSHVDIWVPEECLAVFPASRNPTDMQELRAMETTILQNPPKFEDYIGKPVPIDATPMERMKENWAERHKLCLYDERMQEAKYVHFPVDHSVSARLLVHFYAFLYFQSWKQDLWMKRFIRDHVRYTDEIQCAAARVVAAVREHARNKDPVNNPLGLFDAFHVRRGDFQYKATRVEASELLSMAQRRIPDGTTLYMATDERDKQFFSPLKEHYDLVFLDDFHDQALVGINTNFYGMIDQLVATRSRVFFGCWFSTFTGYINRIRGYHADEEQLPGYEKGIIDSWFYALPDRYDHMQTFYPVKKSFYAREFPTSWRLIDTTFDTK